MVSKIKDLDTTKPTDDYFDRLKDVEEKINTNKQDTKTVNERVSMFSEKIQSLQDIKKFR